MKKLGLILLFIPLISLGQFQEKLAGIWQGERTNYYSLIVHNKETGLQFVSVSWEEGNILQERIEKEGEDYIITSLYNPDSDWNVKIKYTLLNENEILCEFTGDSENKSVYKRVYIEDLNRLLNGTD